MDIKTDGSSTRDYAKEQLEPSDAARRSIAALGYNLRVSTYGDSWALEYNGFLHSNWMTIYQVEAFAAGVDRTLWTLGLDEAAYRVTDREETIDRTYRTEAADKTYKTEAADKTYKTEAADRTYRTEAADKTYRTEAADKTYKTEAADKTYKTEAADKTDKYDGPCDHCDRCKIDTVGQHHDVTMFHQHFIEWMDDVMDDMICTFNLDSKEE